MCPILRGKWIEALQSGKYRQGKGFLHRKNRFCCLGVLCNIYDNSRWEKVDNLKEHFLYDGTNEKEFLEYRIRRKFGIPFSVMTRLMYMNDMGRDFEYIAKYIENNL